MSSRSMPGDNDVPSNKFQLTSYADLQRRETPLVLRRLIELQHRPILGNFDLAHLQAIHRYLFQDVYDWAGEIRSVTISKPDATFPPPQYLKPSLESGGEMEGQHTYPGHFSEMGVMSPYLSQDGRSVSTPHYCGAPQVKFAASSMLPLP
jgi:fido (protein-threonine AMPylation protein)